MNINIYSRKSIEAIIADGKFPENTAVISFYDPAIKRIDECYTHVDYSGVCNTVFYSELDDLDLDVLKRKGYTYDTYFPEADDIAAFIYRAYDRGMDIICQCENMVRAEVLVVQRLFWNIFIKTVFLYLQIIIIIPIRLCSIKFMMHL